jgi:putative drug exporter of the RND superfamily
MVFSRIAAAVVRRPWLVISVWFLAAFALAGVAVLKGPEVTTGDQADFLPTRYESAKALQVARTEFGEARGSSAVTVLVKPADAGHLDGADAKPVGAVAAGLSHWRPDWSDIPRPETAPPIGGDEQKHLTRVAASSSATVDPHGFALVTFRFAGKPADPWVQAAFKAFRRESKAHFNDAGYRASFTGGVASITDNADKGRAGQQLGQLLLFAAAILLSGLFFRGVLAAVIPFSTVATVGAAAGGLVVLGADLLGRSVSTNTPGLISVVLIGIGIDYFMFLLFRFREGLRAGENRADAALAATRRIAPVVASAAMAIVVAFATLGLAQFGELQTLGPAIALSVALMLLAGVTLMPALLAVTGTAMFWPSKAWRRPNDDGFATRLGVAIARHPRRTAAASLAVLALLSVGALEARLSYDTDANAAGTESARVSDELARTLPRGATDPQSVYVRSRRALKTADLQPLARRMAEVPGVAQVRAPVLARDHRAARISVVLRDESTTGQAMDVAGGGLRDAAHAAAPEGSEAMVGGRAAVMADVRDSIDHDLRLILPLAAGLIGLILVAMLRSAVAPLYLLAVVGLEFTATLGASAWLFQDALGQPGVIFTLPLVLFLFVVALGTDYNMLASARLREEMRADGSTRAAVATAVRHTAPAVAAASAVLAASFATLIVESDQATKQTGFAMAFGILLAANVVSTLLVPSLTMLVGRAAWWPGNRRPGGRPTVAADAPPLIDRPVRVSR